jgi:hypothetical protein
MPFEIARNDITNMQVDALSMLPAGFQVQMQVWMVLSTKRLDFFVRRSEED